MNRQLPMIGDANKQLPMLRQSPSTPNAMGWKSQLGSNFKKMGPLLNKLGIGMSAGGAALDVGAMANETGNIQDLIRKSKSEAYQNPLRNQTVDRQSLDDLSQLEAGNRLTGGSDGYLGDGLKGAVQPGSLIPLLAAKLIPGGQALLPLALANTLKQGTAGAKEGQSKEKQAIMDLYQKLSMANQNVQSMRKPSLPPGFQLMESGGM